MIPNLPESARLHYENQKWALTGLVIYPHEGRFIIGMHGQRFPKVYLTAEELPDYLRNLAEEDLARRQRLRDQQAAADQAKLERLEELKDIKIDFSL